MPRGDDDEIVARREPLPCFGELLFRELALCELAFAELAFAELAFANLAFSELLAGRAFLEFRTLIRFWSSTVVNCTRAELTAIRRCVVLHMGYAVRTHVSEHRASGAGG
jgi:hypothetical protein